LPDALPTDGFGFVPKPYGFSRDSAISVGERRGKGSNLQLTRYLHGMANGGTARIFSALRELRAAEASAGDSALGWPEIAA
jgi:hypothetical protein